MRSHNSLTSCNALMSGLDSSTVITTSTEPMISCKDGIVMIGNEALDSVSLCYEDDLSHADDNLLLLGLDSMAFDAFMVVEDDEEDLSPAISGNNDYSNSTSFTINANDVDDSKLIVSMPDVDDIVLTKSNDNNGLILPTLNHEIEGGMSTVSPTRKRKHISSNSCNDTTHTMLNSFDYAYGVTPTDQQRLYNRQNRRFSIEGSCCHGTEKSIDDSNDSSAWLATFFDPPPSSIRRCSLQQHFAGATRTASENFDVDSSGANSKKRQKRSSKIDSTTNSRYRRNVSIDSTTSAEMLSTPNKAESPPSISLRHIQRMCKSMSQSHSTRIRLVQSLLHQQYKNSNSINNNRTRTSADFTDVESSTKKAQLQQGIIHIDTTESVSDSMSSPGNTKTNYCYTVYDDATTNESSKNDSRLVSCTNMKQQPQRKESDLIQRQIRGFVATKETRAELLDHFHIVIQQEHRQN